MPLKAIMEVFGKTITGLGPKLCPAKNVGFAVQNILESEQDNI